MPGTDPGSAIVNASSWAQTTLQRSNTDGPK